jgi:hypothetical protein
MTVVKLAQPGYDVKKAGDANLIYNSAWPTLKIYEQGKCTITDTPGEQTIATHDLGITPFFWWFTDDAITNWSKLTTVNTRDNRSEFSGYVEPAIITDTTKLKARVTAPIYTGDIDIYYYIFALDLTTDYTAPKINLSLQSQAGGGSNVFKIAKPGKNIKSTHLEDYVLHSDARSPMVHMVKTLEAVPDPSSPGGFAASVYHGLPYVPITFFFQRVAEGVPNGYVRFSSGSQSTPSFKVDDQKVTYFSSSASHASVVILKDPFTIDNVIKVGI